MSTKIKDATRAQAADGILLPVSDGSNRPKNITLGKVKEYAVGDLATTLADHDHAISPYSKHNPLPLTANLARNKMLVMEGDMVVVQNREGWGITRVDSSQFAAIGLTMGDTILLPMAHMDAEGKPVDNLMVTGAVLFAAEEVIRDAQGEVIYTRRTSLFRASNDEIATWGGVKKWLAIADGESLLICHPLDITEATVTRNGNDAANAAADLNQRRRIDEKFTRGGYDPDAMVGWAGRLTPTEKTESAAYKDELLPAARLIGYAPELGSIGAGDSIAERVSPVMREVAGVACGGNQYVDWNSYVDNDSFKFNGDEVEIKPDGTNYNHQSRTVNSTARIVQGRKYMTVLRVTLFECQYNNIRFLFPNPSQPRVSSAIQIGGIGVYSCIMEAPSSSTASSQRLTVSTEVVSNVLAKTDRMKFKTPILLDLTALPQLSDILPTLYTGTNAAKQAAVCAKVAHRLGFFALQRD